MNKRNIFIDIFLLISIKGEECCTGYFLNENTGDCESKYMKRNTEELCTNYTDNDE